MVNVLPSSSADDISPHHKMCFSNFENALIHKIDSYLPRKRNNQFGWSKDFDTMIPLICRKLFNAYWNDGTGRPFGKNDCGLVMNIKAKLQGHMPKFVEKLSKLEAKFVGTCTFDNAIKTQSARPCHDSDYQKDCKWHECFAPRVAFASEIITSFLAQKQGRTKAVVAGRKDPRSTMEAFEDGPIAWSKFIDEE
jgi:hypothetical protein